MNILNKVLQKQFKNRKNRGLVITFVYLIGIIALLVSANPGNIVVLLVSPGDGAIFTIPNVTLVCNMSSDGDPSYIELYTNANGSFSKVSGKYLKGSEKGNGTVLLMHFNKDFFVGENEVHVYDWSGNGGNGTVLGVSYNDSGGKFFGAFEFNGSDNRIEVPDSNSLDLVCVGSIEFWLKIAGMSGSTRVLMKGNSWGSGGFPYSVFLKTNKRVYVWLETSDVEAFSSSTLEYNKWYHVAVTWDCSDGFWNDSDAKIYINGSLDGSFSGEFAQNMFVNNKDLEIGGQTLDYGGSFDFPLNGTIDELVLYDRVLTPDEVSSHYNMSFENLSGAEWNISFSEDGTYLWNCLAYDNETSNWSTMNYTFHVDVSTPPAVIDTNLSPRSEDDVDPGVNISVTANVTDISNVSTVILQYKAPLASLYINDTMDYSASKGLWENGTIETTDENGNWSYRIWSNDTNGNSGYSATFILPVEKDKTWSLLIINSSGNYSDSFGSVTGFKGAVQTLGILIINNTGDFTLGFNLDSTPVTVTISYNVTLPFDVSFGDEKHIEVNATMPETPNEYGLTMNITSSEAIPPYREANATVISYIGGPYINETTEITDYPLSITQSNSANFTASIKNIGNETAVNVWLNWTFPSGWSLTFGNQTNLLGNLTPQASASVTVRAFASSSASAGAAMIWVNSSSGGTAGSDLILLPIGCNSNDGACGTGCNYLTDGNCEAPSEGAQSEVLADLTRQLGAATDPADAQRIQDAINTITGSMTAINGVNTELTKTAGATNWSQVLLLGGTAVFAWFMLGKPFWKGARRSIETQRATSYMPTPIGG